MDIKQAAAALTITIAAAGTGYVGTVSDTTPDYVEPYEVVSMRTETSETFDTGQKKVINGLEYTVYRTSVNTEPIHYRTATETTWKKIDPALKAKPFLKEIYNEIIGGRPYEIQAGAYAAEFYEVNTWDYKFTRNGASVEFEALFDSTHVFGIKTDSNNRGVKEIVILDEKSLTTLQWRVTVEGEIREGAKGGWAVLNGDGETAFTIPALTAVDSKGGDVPVSATMEEEKLTAYILTAYVDARDAVFPVMLDPSTTITPAAYGNTRSTDAVWQTARDAATATGVDANYFKAGTNAPSNYTVNRTVMIFDLSLSAKTVDACSLKVTLDGRFGTQDYYVYSGKSAISTSVDTGDFPLFDGRQTTAQHNGSILATNSNPGGTGAYYLPFNSAGRDTVLAKKTTTLWLVAMGNQDKANSYVEAYITGGSPELIIYYTLPDPINPPTGFFLDTPTTTGMKAHWTPHHSALVDSQTVVDVDTTGHGKTPGVQDTTLTLTGLLPNKRYIFMAKVDSTGAGKYMVSNKDTCATLPAAPLNVRTKSTRAKSLFIDFDANGNPDSTRYALRIVWAPGDTSWWTGTDTTKVASSVIFKTHTGWGDSIKVGKDSGLFLPDTAYKIGVVAQNMDGRWGETTWLTATTSQGKLERIWLNDVATPNILMERWASSSAVYATNRGDTTHADISTTHPSNSRVGQFTSGDYTTFRWGLLSALPDGKAAYACSLSFVPSNVAPLGTQFNLSAFRGLWPAVPAVQLVQSYWNFSTWASGATAYSGAPQFTLFNTTGISNGTRYKVAFSDSGMNTVRNALNGNLKMSILSHRDSAGTAPTGNEYFDVIPDSSYLSLFYDPVDQLPASFTAVAITKDSVVVTWTERNYSEYKYVLVDLADGTPVAGADSIAKNAASARIGGLTPNTKYRWGLKTIGGNLDGQICPGDSASTLAAKPAAPTRSNPAPDSTKIIINANGNPSYTKFALGAVTTVAGETLHVDFGTWPRRLIPGVANKDSVRHWAIRDSIGGDGGVTVATGVGKWYKWIVRAKSGE